MNPAKATAALEGIPPAALEPYQNYFLTITPRSTEDIFRRGLFAFASVHTTWKANVNLFSMLYDLAWRGSKDMLHELLVESRAGLTENRTKAIWEFNQKFWSDPAWYSRRQEEPWTDYRNRIEAETFGLGHAKSSFFIELIQPHEAEVVCGDTHQLQHYGLKGNSSPRQRDYDYVEAHWVSECHRLGIPPVAARWYLWDRKQGKNDSRYWSYCIEGGKPARVAPLQLELFSWKETCAAQPANVLF